MLRFVFGSLLLVGLFSSSLAFARVTAGQELTSFDLPLLSDTSEQPRLVGVGDFIGAKASKPARALLLVFFASWCEPCKAELPEWNRLYNAYAKEGLAILMVSVDQEPEGIVKAREFINAQKPPFPVLSDRLSLVSRRYFDEQIVLPSAFLIGSNGGVSAAYSAETFRFEAIEAAIKEKLKEAPLAKAPEGKTANSLMVWRLERKSDAIKDEEVDSLSGVLIAEVGRQSESKVISEYDLRTMVKKEETVQRCGLDAKNPNCMMEISHALGAPEAISGDVGRIGQTWIFNLRRTGIQKGEGLGQSSRQVEGTLDDLIALIPGMVAELFGKQAPLTPAILRATSTPDGAALREGTQELGKTPLKRHFDPGQHELIFSFPGYLDLKRSVTLKSGESLVLAVDLEKVRMSPHKIAGFATFFPGLAVVALGGVFTWQAKAQMGEHDSAVTRGDYSTARGKRDRSRLFSTISLGSYALGGAAMLSGIVLWAVAPDDAEWAREHLPNVAPAVSGKGVVVSQEMRF